MLAAALAAAAGLVYTTNKLLPSRHSPNTAGPQKVKITASFFPLYDFAQNVGGDYVQVKNITPAGAEPHDYEPTPQDIAKIYDSKLLILNGNGVDAWGEKMQNDLESKGIIVVKMSDNLNSLKSNTPDEPDLQYDPHFWLNPVYAEKEVDLIADALVKIDPGHQAEYNQNRVAYKAKLSELDQEYKTGLAQCQQQTIVTSHNAFNYLAAQYNLSALYILGLSPDEEPSAKTLADTAAIVRQKNIKYIFFESLLNPKLAQTLASETGAQTLELNPIEGLTPKQLAQGKNYLSQMRANLANLKIALQCQ